MLDQLARCRSTACTYALMCLYQVEVLQEAGLDTDQRCTGRTT